MDREFASVEVRTKDGSVIDANNISGKKKLELIEAGKIQLDSFVMPANMPGKLLKAMREKHAVAFSEIVKKGKEYTKSKTDKSKTSISKESTKSTEPIIKEAKKVKTKFEKGELVLLGKHQTKIIKFKSDTEGNKYLVKTRENKRKWKLESELTKVNLNEEPEEEVIEDED